MQEVINKIIIELQNYSLNFPFFVSILFSSFIIILESILPMLPLGLFIAFNMILLGGLFGIIVSWIATSLGCLLSFSLVRYLKKTKYVKKFLNNEKVNKIMKRIDKMSLSKFVLITALPFTPAFLINISAGLSNMSIKKFITGIIISKIFIVYFWGYIGTTFTESVTDILVLIKLAIMLLLAYLVSRFVMKKYNID